MSELKREIENPGKVIVAMSGGVDSAVTALLLQEQGYETIGVNLRVWEYEEGCATGGRSCCSPEDIQDARAVGLKLSIPFYVFRMEDRFESSVIAPFIQAYREGATPNPCVACNSFIKFGTLFEKARSMGIGKIATGHYARVVQLPNGRWAVREGVDSTKNQSYYLYGLSQEALEGTLFPLGEMRKTEVREIAARHGLKVAQKPESQEICFIPDDDYRAFLTRRGVLFTPGRFLLRDGQVVGSHSGKEKFTIGQRKGLGVSWSEPLYVLEIQESGDVILGTRDETYIEEFRVEDLTFQGLDPLELERDGFALECRVQIRYRSRPARCTIRRLSSGSIHVTMRDQVSSAAPGQSAVFYPEPGGEIPEDAILAGGIIRI